MGGLIVRFNNWLTRRRNIKVPAGNVLLLVPHCLQHSKCGQDVAGNLDACGHCGRCKVCDLIRLRDTYGLQCHLAGGGREALARASDESVKVIVAVACEKELVDGMRAVFPKPVLAVVNSRLNGPCKDTTVDIESVEAALKQVMT